MNLPIFLHLTCKPCKNFNFFLIFTYNQGKVLLILHIFTYDQGKGFLILPITEGGGGGGTCIPGLHWELPPLPRIAAGLDGGKLIAATFMPLQALFLDEMIDNDTELIALNSNDDDIFYLTSLRRNHEDHVPRIREYLQLDLQFRHHFRMSRPTVEQLCLLLGNCPQVPSEFSYITGRPPIQLQKQVSMIRKSQFLCIEVTKIGEKWLVLLILQGQQASVVHLGTLHGYFSHQDFVPNLNFLLEYQIKLVLICRYSGKLFIRCSAS